MTHEPSAIQSWFTGRLPDDWTRTTSPIIDVDRDEIVVTIGVEAPALDEDASPADRAEALAGRVSGFRDETRDRRIAIAREAEHRFQRKVSWAVSIGDETHLFTHLALPVMTRLRQPERRVLDTLVAANVARSRAEAVAWCVRLVGENTDDWLSDLRDAMRDVERVRDAGPDVA